MPLPEENDLAQIGEKIERIEIRDPAIVERIVGQALHLPGRLIEQLVEVA